MIGHGSTVTGNLTQYEVALIDFDSLVQGVCKSSGSAAKKAVVVGSCCAVARIRRDYQSERRRLAIRSKWLRSASPWAETVVCMDSSNSNSGGAVNDAVISALKLMGVTVAASVGGRAIDIMAATRNLAVSCGKAVLVCTEKETAYQFLRDTPSEVHLLRDMANAPQVVTLDSWWGHLGAPITPVDWVTVLAVSGCKDAGVKGVMKRRDAISKFMSAGLKSTGLNRLAKSSDLEKIRPAQIDVRVSGSRARPDKLQKFFLANGYNDALEPGTWQLIFGGSW